jgi:hypothetical protein
LKGIDTPILNHVSWRCPISIRAEDAKKQLGTAVVVTRYFEALVNYDFKIEQKIVTYTKIDASAPKTEVAKTDTKEPTTDTTKTETTPIDASEGVTV